MPNIARDSRKATDLKGHDIESLAELGLVSASIVHEVKNALQGVANALYLLERDQSLRPAARGWIAAARRELSRAFEASRQTLSLVREETPVLVSLPEILNEVLDAYAGKAEYKKITVERRYDFKGNIEVNPAAVREIFSNLVLNALEAVPRRSGKLAVSTSAASRVNGNVAAGVQIQFADNGPGVPDKYKSKVFEPLFSTKRGKGTGLGLWVSEKLAQQQHGALQLESSNNGHRSGGCFSVFLPLKQE